MLPNNLLLLISDFVLRCRPDKYQTMQVVAFTQQLLTHGGYYDEHLEFIRVERIQVRLQRIEPAASPKPQPPRCLQALLAAHGRLCLHRQY
jgi:hypothetical protein